MELKVIGNIRVKGTVSYRVVAAIAAVEGGWTPTATLLVDQSIPAWDDPSLTIDLSMAISTLSVMVDHKPVAMVALAAEEMAVTLSEKLASYLAEELGNVIQLMSFEHVAEVATDLDRGSVKVVYSGAPVGQNDTPVN